MRHLTLLQNNSLWYFLGNAFPLSLIIMKKNGEILYTNEKFFDITKSQPNNITEIIDTTKKIRTFKYQLRKCLSQQIPVKNCIKIKTRKSECELFEYTLIPQDSENICMFFAPAFVSDEKFKDLLAIFNAIPDPIFIKNKQHQYLLVNQSFANMIGVDSSEIIGKSDTDFFSKNEVKHFYELDNKTYETSSLTINNEKVTGVNGTKIVSTKKDIFTNQEGEEILVGIIRDIHDFYIEKQTLERASSRKNTLLEQKKKALNEALNQIKKLKQEINSSIYMCSHELRKPLRIVRSLAQIADGEIPEHEVNIKKYFSHIQNEIVKMADIVDLVLSLAQNQNSQVKMGEISIYDIVLDVLQYHRDLINGKNIYIDISDLPNIKGDPIQIYLIFQNIIDNAIKYSLLSESPHIKIYSPQNENYTEICIADNGIGIPKESINKLFQPLSKLHTTQQGSKHGLGLYICKEIMMQHGGMLDISSTEGVETIVSLKFLKQV